MNKSAGIISARLAQSASVVTSAGYSGLHSRDEFNAAGDHIAGLIRASYALYRERHFAPSLFLSITTFEETAKVKAGHMRSWDGTSKTVKRSNDPLFKHPDKHKIAVDPILLVSGRLAKSIGLERVKEIFTKYEVGEYSTLREDSLYFSRNQSGLHLPSELVTKRMSAEHLLIAIEIFDNYFDFFTAEVSQMCVGVNKIYSQIEESINES